MVIALFACGAYIVLWYFWQILLHKVHLTVKIYAAHQNLQLGSLFVLVFIGLVHSLDQVASNMEAKLGSSIVP